MKMLDVVMEEVVQVRMMTMRMPIRKKKKKKMDD